VSVDDIWDAWKAWCEDQARHHGTKAIFGRDLRAAVPGLRVERPRDGDTRHRLYVGVGLPADLFAQAEPEPDDDDYPRSAWDASDENP
jgi:hypothetical protein